MRIDKSTILGIALAGALLLIVLPIVTVIGFLVYAEYDEMVHTPKAIRKLPEVEKEFHQIQPLPVAAPTSEPWTTTAAHHVTVGNLYRTSLTYSEIRAYYEGELAKHGWKFQKELNVNGPDGKDYGGKQLFYSKGESTAFIYHVGAKPNPDYTYVFSVSWDS